MNHFQKYRPPNVGLMIIMQDIIRNIFRARGKQQTRFWHAYLIKDPLSDYNIIYTSSIFHLHIKQITETGV